MNDTINDKKTDQTITTNNAPILPAVTDSATTNQTDAASTLLNLESLIKNYLTKIDVLKEELKKEKEMFDDSLVNDAVYTEHLQKVIEATNIKNSTRKQILKQPAVIAVAEKVKTIREQMKELQSALSSYLQQYYEQSGLKQIETDTGETMEIVVTAKLVKKSAFRP